MIKPDAVHMRQTERVGDVLRVSPAAWAAFLAGLKNGEFAG
jgi:hypothetical protein